MALSSFQRLLRPQGRTIEVSWSEEPLAPAWDEFVESLPTGHHEQTSLWGQVRARYGWEVGRVVLTENGQIVAGAQILLRPVGPFARWAYVTYGPCLLRPDPLVEGLVLTELCHLIKRLGAVFLILGLPYESCYSKSQLRLAGLERKPLRLPPHFLEATVVVNLAQPSEVILSQMRRNTRRNIRHAAENGVQVVLGDKRDIATFHRLMLALCERRKTSPNPPQEGFFQLLWSNFAPKGWVRVFLAMHRQEPVSAALAFTFGDWFRVWKVGWLGPRADLKPNEAMWWHMMQYAKQEGFRNFDLVSLDPIQARALLDGKAPHSVIDSVSYFKLGLGGDIKLLPGAYLYFPNPLIRMAMRFGLAKCLGSTLASILV